MYSVMAKFVIFLGIIAIIISEGHGKAVFKDIVDESISGIINNDVLPAIDGDMDSENFVSPEQAGVENKQLMLPETTVPEEGGMYCHSAELTLEERYIVGFEPIAATDDVSHISLYGCLQGPSNNDEEWQCPGVDNICQGPAVIMYDWKRNGCDNYLARSELIIVGGQYLSHVVLVVGYDAGGYTSTSGLNLKLMPTTFKDTPGLTETVEYYSSAFNYKTKCPDAEDSTSNPPSVDDSEGDMEANMIHEEVEVDSDGEIYDDASFAIYDSSLPRYQSSYSQDVSSVYDPSDTVNEIDRLSADESEIAPESIELESIDLYGGYELSEGDSSIDILINYLTEYWNNPDVSQTASHLVTSGWWPRQELPIGQIAGLDIDLNGNLVLFRRGERSWKPNDFDNNDIYIHDTPIRAQTLIVVDPATGKIVEAWGKDRFYLPHGLTIDHESNLWLTDVAMHQVFKFSSDSDHPSMTFGQAFTPGSDADHLCKPTDVAICPKTGAIFISDGYCNSRVLKFSANGTLLLEITAHNPESVSKDSNLANFRIAHSLAMVESREWICVADRENARVQCFSSKDGTFAAEYTSPRFGREVFAIAYNPLEDVLYAVNGPQLKKSDVPTAGFTIDLESGDIIDMWTPAPEKFGVLHDIARSPENGNLFVADIDNDRIWRFVEEDDEEVLNNIIY